MKKLITLIIVWLFSVMTSSAQAQYPTDIFDNYTPVWLHRVYDSTATPPMDPDRYNRIEYLNGIIQDSFMYSLFKYTYKYREIEGGRIEKLNINTGAMEWVNNYDLRNIEKNENPNRMYFNDKGNLEVPGYRLKNRRAGSQDIEDPKLKFVLREFNPDNGELTRFVHEPDGDSMGIEVYGLSNWYASLFPYEKNRYLASVASWGANAQIGYIIDTLGIAVDSVNMNIQQDKQHQRIETFWQISQDTFFSTLTKANREGSYFSEVSSYIVTINHDFTKVDTVNITGSLKPSYDFWHEISYADDSLFVLFYKNEPEPFKWTYHYYIYDYKGNLLDTINIKSDYSTTFAIKKTSYDEFIFVGTSFRDENSFSTLKFYKKKIGHTKELLREIRIKDKHKMIFVKDIHVLNNKDVLVIGYFTGLFEDFSNVWEIKFPIFIRFKGEDIWDYVSTAESVKIAKEKNYTGEIEIIDQLGRKLRAISVKNTRKVNIDVSKLSSGVYFINAQDKKRGVEYKKEKFVVR